MTTMGALSASAVSGPEMRGDAEAGWYLYGITRCGVTSSVLTEAGPIELLELAGVAAVVRRVHLADFGEAVLQKRLADEAELESMVRSHNGVIEAIHARQAILPARFGMVYPHVADIVAALQSTSDVLLRELDRLTGCDEWAVHLYADRAIIRQLVALGNPAIRRLREQAAVARPGRAYFLERQLHAELESATAQQLVDLAQSAFDRLSSASIAAQSNGCGVVADPTDEVEILRAALLVARTGAESFEGQVAALADFSAGLRSECSGPWPAYSFAARWHDEAK